MADSDDEDTLVSFGTPFELLEEDAPRKKAIPIHDQIVTDSEGRRRFHGAFTGGFSAGYFNSVGTKEGWQPSTFVSSRSKKFEHTAQRPEDFMDDEDMGEFGIAPKRITTKEKFLSEEQEIQNRRKRIIASDDSQGIIPGELVLQDLVLPVKMSVGVELLKKMGWKEGQGVGARERRTKRKVYGCSLPPGLSSQTTADNTEEEDIFAVGLLFAPKDVDTFTFTPKDDKHGLGYKGLDPSTALFVREDWLGVDPVSSKVGKKGIRGQAFGVGAFEEDDDDIYAIDHMSHYDVELTAEHSSVLHGWTGPPKENARGGALSIFSATPKAMDVMKSFPPPAVPHEFNCTHNFNSSASDPTSTSQEGLQERKTLTASDRGEILGEEPLPTPKKSVFDYMSKEDKDRVLSSSKKITPEPSSVASGSSANSSVTVSAQDLSSKVWSGHSSFKPFAKDPAKQARYEEFLKMGKGKQVCQKIKESGLTEWEREREKEEFARSASLYRPLNSTMAARFMTAKHPDDHRTAYKDVPAQEPSDSSEQTNAARMKMFGKLTRDIFEWHPNNILCKRFNIPNPYPGSDVVGVPKLRRPKFTLGDFITPQTESPRAVTYEVSFSSSEGQRKSDNIGKRSEAIEPKVSETPSESAVVEMSDFTSSPSAGSSFKPTSITRPKGPEAATNVLSNTSEKTAPNQVQGDADSAPKRPSMDLFKAIFADSSDDESNTSDGERIKGSESLSIQTQTEDKASSEATNVHADVKTDSIEETDSVLFEHKMSEEEEEEEEDLISAKQSEMNQVPPAIESKTKEECEKSTPHIFGPVLPPSFGHTKISVSEENRAVDFAHIDEESNRKRGIKRDKRKDTKKRCSESSDNENDDSSRKKELSGHLSSEKYNDSRTETGEDIAERKRGVRKGAKKRDSGSDSEDDYRSNRRHKHKEKKHKHKHKSKSKHRDAKKEKSSEKKNEQNKSNQSEQMICVSEDKQILNKLKNLQNLKAAKRMRAADFM